MFEPISAYIMSISAMLFAACSAVSLFTALEHLESPTRRPAESRKRLPEIRQTNAEELSS